MSKLTRESTSQFVKVEDINIHYNDTGGDGPPVVMIHGAGPGAYGWSNYARNVPHFAEKFRVLVPDLPGFGRSDVKPVGSAMPEWYATKMSQFLDALGIGKAHFIGNSLGGMVTLRLAMDRPDKVDRMVLMGTGGSLPVFSQYPTKGIKSIFGFYEGDGPSLEKLRAFAGEFTFDKSEVTEELLQSRLDEAMQPHILDTPPMRPNRAAKYEDIWRDVRLTKLPHETMMVWGREDRVNPLDMAFVLLKQIRRCRLYVLPQCGHWAQWEHWEEFNRVTMDFLGAENVR